MRKLLFAIFFVASAAYAQTPVTLLENMNTSSPGTTLTTTILNAGMESGTCTAGSSSFCYWSAVAASGMTVGNPVGGCGPMGSVGVIGGSTYARGTSNMSLEISNADALTTAESEFRLHASADREHHDYRLLPDATGASRVERDGFRSSL